MSLLPGAEIQVAFRYEYLGQKCENVQTYICAGIPWAGATMDQALEALWNDYKARLRAAAPANPDLFQFVSLYGVEHGGGLNFAEYPIPTAEIHGLRGTTSDVTWLSSFTAWGFRQTVATRLTRPGQKRFPWLVESDVTGNDFAGGVNSLWADVANAFSSVSVLGAPVATATLIPSVVHEPGARDPVRHVQAISGYVFNPHPTTQVSRKLGRGN